MLLLLVKHLQQNNTPVFLSVTSRWWYFFLSQFVLVNWTVKEEIEEELVGNLTMRENSAGFIS